MSKLMDIKGYWDKSYGYNFNDRDMWEGQILLQDDGWFEGIVVDPNSSYTEDRFIFGVYHPEKVIELFKFTPINVSAPFVFHGKRDVKGYIGKFETIGILGTMPCGNSHIITQYAEIVRDGIDEETKQLEEKIQNYKSSIMDAASKDFYEKTIDTRTTLSQTILTNYKNQSLLLDDDEKQPKKLVK